MLPTAFLLFKYILIILFLLPSSILRSSPPPYSFNFMLFSKKRTHKKSKQRSRPLREKYQQISTNQGKPTKTTKFVLGWPTNLGYGACREVWLVCPLSHRRSLGESLFSTCQWLSVQKKKKSSLLGA